MLTTALIPTNGVFITETQFPKGFTVARYDARGFMQEGARWFATMAAARAHAEKL